ncbi:MAG TPA: aminotransferase class V-fold PLP-dependent enzyme [Thermoanaerobaculia bacterium]|jgi:selenocysteine lyase/cysteine desulfurase
MLTFAELRRREFSRLDEQRHTYADYTGSALYGASQLRAQQALLAGEIFGNPHSESPASRATTEAIERARDLVLQFFGADRTTHEVVFTANTTAAIKLVAESYPFDGERACVLSIDNHNSVNGIREYARRAGAPIHYLNLECGGVPPLSKGLFSFPAQSNFSGNQYPLNLVDAAHERGLDVLLDAAAYAPSHTLSLRDCNADFVAISFYKLFGYPTGVGALIARRDALAKLRRPWFAGGTVLYASVDADRHRLRPGHDAFEDGTPNFLGIAALPAGFALLNEIGMARIAAHVDRLTSMFVDEVRDFATMYGRTTLNIDGVPYWEVEESARRENISLRGGCFCNPGASELAFGLRRAGLCLDILGDDFSVQRFAACTGHAVGAVRVSFGIANNEADVARVADFLRRIHLAARRPQFAATSRAIAATASN